MGMFDNVRYSAPCFKCGRVLTDWQSKSGNCLMETLEVDQVTNLYTECDNRQCKAWNEYNTDAIEHETQIIEIGGTGLRTGGGGSPWLDPGKYRVTRISNVRLTLQPER